MKPVQPESSSSSEPVECAALGPRLGWLGLLFVLVAFACVTCVGVLSRGPSMGDHECINAVAARQSIENGHLLIPQVNGDPWVRKTPLGTWLIAGAAWLLEPESALAVSDFTARLPSAVAGVINALAVAWLGSMLFGRRAGWVAGFIAASAAGTIFFARNAQVEMPMAALVTLCFACFWRGALHARPARWAMVAFYVALSLAMLAKAPLPLAIVGGALFVYWFIVRPVELAEECRRTGKPQASWSEGIRCSLRDLGKLRLLTGTLLFVVLFGAWPLYVYWQVPGVLELWRTEYLDRASGEMSEADKGPLYYLPLLFALVVPYTLSLTESLAAPFLPWYRMQRRGLRYVFTWAVFGTLFLSVMAFKRPHYLAPVLPAYCLLLAPVIDRLFFGEVELLVPRFWVRRAMALAPVLIVVAAVVGGFVLRREFPAMVSSYAVMAGAVAILWSAAALTYGANRRGMSFVLLNAGVAAATLIGWPGIGRHLAATPEPIALAAKMKQCGITNHDEIYWVGKRPKATLEFYAHLTAKRLMTDLELANMRRGREDVSQDILAEYAHRMQEQLSRAQPVYLVMESGYYYLFERQTGIKAKVLIELHGYNDDPGEDLIVVTQPGATSSGPVAEQLGSSGEKQPVATATCPATASNTSATIGTGEGGKVVKRKGSMPANHPDISAPRSGPHFSCHENNANQDQANSRPLPD